ncbi:helix-turn-helix domain-containing protein [Methylorubrum zatmanii]
MTEWDSGSVRREGAVSFSQNGYEATTLDAIAEASAISRRTFFYYFTSKEEILLDWLQCLAAQGGSGPACGQDAIRGGPRCPVRDALLKLSAGFRTQEFISIECVLRSNEALRARKQAAYSLHEQALHAVLVERWPDPARSASLRLVAMASLGAMRLAIEAWIQAGGDQPLAAFLQSAFAGLTSECCKPSR